MNARVKSILLLLVTLLIGMVLGALLNARIAEQRMERIAFLRSQRGFVRYLERAIEPRDEAQAAAVQAILQEAADRTAEHMVRSRTEMRAIIDSAKSELGAVLTEEQMQRLEERLDLRRFDGRRWRENRAPPPDRRPRR